MTETLSHIALRRLNGPEASDWYTPVSDEGGPFRILGRKDNVICSGGIKIQIEEVERLLSPHLSAPFMITKRPDEKFGEQVVLLTESNGYGRC